jgi:hypothetical protein
VKKKIFFLKTFTCTFTVLKLIRLDQLHLKPIRFLW